MAEGDKKLYRSNDNRWLAGVCGGIGEYLNVDPTLIRVLFILFSFAVGGGLIIYIILWIVMPTVPEEAGIALVDVEESEEPLEKEEPEEEDESEESETS